LAEVLLRRFEMLVSLSDQILHRSRDSSRGGAGRRHRPRRFRGLASIATKDSVQSVVQRRLHDHLVRIGYDNSLQFRDGRASLGGEVQRLDIQDGILHRYHQQCAANYPGSTLVPERKLLRDRRTLVDTRLNLFRAVDQFFFRESENEDLSVIGSVATRRDPGNHVVLPRGRKRNHQNEFLALPHLGQFHDGVIRTHGRRCPVYRPRGHAPQVFLAIEDAWVRHVIHSVLSCLNSKKILGVTDVRPKVRRHLRERLKNTGKDVLIGLDQWIGWIAYIKLHAS